MNTRAAQAPVAAPFEIQTVTAGNFRVARQNEAAGAADATAWVMPAAVAVHTFL